MRFKPSFLTLYGVTDRALAGEKTLAEEVEAAIKGGATMIQLREKELGREELLKEALKLRRITGEYGIPLIINDHVDIALECGADGVHVGQEDMEVSRARAALGPDKILGVTAKTVEQARAAQEGGADYLGSGAVFGSATKPDAKPMTRETLKAICRSVDIPVAAIGGINKDNIEELFGTGIAGVASVSGIFGEPDIRQAAEELRRQAERLKRPPVLTIAGSDSSGGAGIQADLKTMTAYRTYGMSVITALTAQNTTGVYGIDPVPPDFVKSQIDCVFQDIRPRAVKIGMVSQADVIEAIAEKLREYQARRVVFDPVMVSTSGSRLLKEDAIESLTRHLFPCADVITPNIPEAQVLSGQAIETCRDMEEAAARLGEAYGIAVLVKGGHQVEDASDVLYQDGEITWFHGTRVHTPNTHGTGCTLSSAIASGLALGEELKESIRLAKVFVHDALASGLNLGSGSGPLDHCVWVRGNRR